MSEPDAKPHNDAGLWPPKMAICVGAVVVRENRVLLVRQAPEASLPGQWSIPWGIVDEGETPEDAAVRETHEEGGVHVEVDGLLGIQNLRNPGWLGIVFLCHPVSGAPAPDGVETDAAAYVSLAGLDELGASVEPWCGWLARRVLAGAVTVTPCDVASPYHPHKGFL